LLAVPHGNSGEDDDGEQEIRGRARCDDGSALPNRLVVEALAALRLAQSGDRFALGHARGVLISEEFHVAAERNCGELPARAMPVGETEKLSPEADRKYLHANAAPPRHEKMPELVEEYDDGQDEQERHDEVIPGRPAAPAGNTREILHCTRPGPQP